MFRIQPDDIGPMAAVRILDAKTERSSDQRGAALLTDKLSDTAGESVRDCSLQALAKAAALPTVLLRLALGHLSIPEVRLKFADKGRDSM